MTFTIRRTAFVAAAALFTTVVTQIFYVTVVANAEGELLRRMTWLCEAASFSLASVTALALAARDRAHPMAWSAIALGALVNVLQVAAGLAMFGPAQAATDDAVFQTVLNGAFFLYFQGKMLFGLAAIGLGISALSVGGLAKALGIAGIVAGLAAAVLAFVGMADGMAWVQSAGAAGTLATALLAGLAVVVTRDLYDRGGGASGH